MLGGVPVRSNQRVRLNITAIMFEPLSVWPGVVAVDDIAFVPGDCPVQQSRLIYMKASGRKFMKHEKVKMVWYCKISPKRSEVADNNRCLISKHKKGYDRPWTLQALIIHSTKYHDSILCYITLCNFHQALLHWALHCMGRHKGAFHVCTWVCSSARVG